ncbi:MAG: hypothetical protein ACI4K6_06055 [Candidatus Fimenecus sp.]
MAKEVLTPEEIAEKKIRRSNGWTRFWAIVLALVLVGASTSFAAKKASEANEEAAAKQAELASQYAAANANAGSAQSWDDGSASGSASSDDAAAPASNEAEEAAKAINAATAAAATAGYDWKRTSEYTKPVDVGSATDVLNKVIQGVDPNANVDSVVGGFIGIGKKEAKIEKGKDAAECIGYHGESYKLKATSLKASDLKDLTVSDGTYTFKLADVNTPKKDGSNSLNRLTDDIVIQEEVSQEIKDQVGSAVTVTSLVGVYSNINVKVVIADGKLTEMTYSYDADVSELGLKVAVVSVKGTGAMHTEASYTNFVY